MIATPRLPTMDSLRVDVMLADAVVLNWSDLMPETNSCLIQIECHVEPGSCVHKTCESIEKHLHSE